ncbi:phosphoenolpyruvate mutase [Oceanispirochaeta sp.]|jgi:phosphoenolpyruvate mutase|uniref:phosphoenolpyruvate mutase n=1 Tax=Oceanispirochaeta sp. TaxID=2035350 RepID=UPI00262A156D|nr:phosphoenolpyruvate mutase [Oceanispirochaeta sp.]MDA3956733.1 phosphoenolpyruvate mutase [Oceanispirochaeta sp.]
MKQVYVALVADFIHPGHLNIIEKARELGEITIGLYTDEAIATFSRLPVLEYEHRRIIAENLKGVVSVVPQKAMSYRQNLDTLKPDYVVHGDDWLIGAESCFREEVLDLLSTWGGKLVELPYSQGFSSTLMASDARKQGTTPEIRMKSLRRLIKARPVVRIMEAHNGLSGLIVEETFVEENGIRREFDGIWESSLTDSASKGKPDTSTVDISSRVSTIDQIMEVTTKPMIVDADNGGLTEHFVYTVRTLERLGVSAVIIEDKIGPKRNSLFGTEVTQTQDTKEEFADKISQGKRVQVTKDFLIIARIESLILETGMKDALERGKAYVEAGVDGIMIHSRRKEPDEILEFCQTFRKDFPAIPLVVVPSSLNSMTEDELADAGVNIVIYANQMLRSAFPAMKKTAESILTHHRAKEAGEYCLSIKEVISLIPESMS